MVILFIKNRGFDSGLRGVIFDQKPHFFQKVWVGAGVFDLSFEVDQPLSAPFLAKGAKSGGGGWGKLQRVGETGFWGFLAKKAPLFHAFYFWPNFFGKNSILNFLPKNSLIKNCFAAFWPKTPRPSVGALLVYSHLSTAFFGFLGFWPKRDDWVKVQALLVLGHHRRP